MLPFLKNQNEASAGGGVSEPIKMKTTEDQDYGMLDAIVEDMAKAIPGEVDKKLLKAALEAFAEHLQDMDEKQDESLLNHKE